MNTKYILILFPHFFIDILFFRSKRPTATQTALGGPLSDEEAGFGVFGDEIVTIESYKLKADLAELKEKAGDTARASELYDEAAQDAMAANMMKLATELSLKAAEFIQ